MLIKYSTATWQRVIVFSVVICGLLVPILLTLSWAVLDWPDFPEHREIDAAKYSERIALLKYFISLGFSLVGATWFLVNNKADFLVLTKHFRCMLSWAWTFIGISLLSAITQIYFTYKDFHYWPLIVESGYNSKLHHLKHCASIHILHFTYKATDYFFFLGALFLIIALIGVLQADDQKKDMK